MLYRVLCYNRIVGRRGIERGFLSQKGSGVGRGVNEKDANVANLEVVKDGVVPSVTVASGNTQVVSTGLSLPTVVDLMMEKDKLSSLEDTTVLESFPPLSTLVTTAGNALGKSSYANITGKPNGKKVNVRTLFTPGGNGIDVVVLVDSIRAISERFSNTTYGSIDRLDAMLENGPWFIRNNLLILKKWHPDENILKGDVSTIPVWVKLHGVPVMAFSKDGLSVIATKLGTPLMLDSYTSDMCMQSWGRSSYARVVIELRADVELKDNIVVAMLKITREGDYTCNVRVEYEWKPPRCSSCKDFRHIHEECPKNTSACENKTVKKPSQTSRVVPIDNDVEFGTNEGTTNLVNNEAISSGSSFINIENDGEFASNTHIVPTGIVESDSEVGVVIDETANLRISTSGKYGSDKGYGTNSLLEPTGLSSVGHLRFPKEL
nr:hypothetical protein [Tanacetum cinerariifolium]